MGGGDEGGVVEIDVEELVFWCYYVDYLEV